MHGLRGGQGRPAGLPGAEGIFNVFLREKQTLNEILGDKWLSLSENIKQEQFYILKRAQELSSFLPWYFLEIFRYSPGHRISWTRPLWFC